MLGHAVKLARLGLLRLVPHRHHAGADLQIALVGQVVPAGDQRRRAWPPRLRGADQIHLIGGRLDERRHQHHVGRLAAEEARRAPDSAESRARPTPAPASSALTRPGGSGANAIQPLQRPRQRLALHPGAQQRRLAPAAGAGSGGSPSCRGPREPGRSSRRCVPGPCRRWSRGHRRAGSRRAGRACLREPSARRAAPRVRGAPAPAPSRRRSGDTPATTSPAGSSWHLPASPQPEPVRQHRRLVDRRAGIPGARAPTLRVRLPGFRRRRGDSSDA